MMLVAFFLIIAASLYRVLPPLLHVQHDWMSNFSPLASLILCGAVFFPKRMAIWVPLSVLLASDFILNYFVYSAPLLSWEISPRYVVFALVGLLAFRQRQILRDQPLRLMGSGVAASLFFYITTNTASWVGDAGYAKNAAGWVQALTTGLPGYEQTIFFFRNSAVSDLLFTTLFVVCMAVTHKKKSVASSQVLAAH